VLASRAKDESVELAGVIYMAEWEETGLKSTRKRQTVLFL